MITALSALAVTLSTGIGAASATTDTTSVTRLALQQAGVSSGAPGVALPVHGHTVRAGGLAITYPDAAAGSRRLDAHTRVFDGRHFDQVVQSTGTDAVRMLTVIADAEAPTRYDYSFAGHELRQLGHGYVAVYDRSGEPVALIEPAWAKDAHGNAVKTRYEIDGSTLSQVVDVDAHTAFPVVADPSVSWHWWGIDVHYSWYETWLTASSAAGCAAVAAAIPDPTLTKAVSISCGLVSAWATAAMGRNKCIAMKKAWVGPLIPWYWSCRH
ncbi:MAG TPA: hypothetical protein VFL94_07355 [Actinomycetales bacterium]|nr:hypothetical protein [Actinomycetales bacterium]